MHSDFEAVSSSFDIHFKNNYFNGFLSSILDPNISLHLSLFVKYDGIHMAVSSPPKQTAAYMVKKEGTLFMFENLREMGL